jgi:hypothetical protein
VAWPRLAGEAHASTMSGADARAHGALTTKAAGAGMEGGSASQCSRWWPCGLDCHVFDVQQCRPRDSQSNRDVYRQAEANGQCTRFAGRGYGDTAAAAGGALGLGSARAVLIARGGVADRAGCVRAAAGARANVARRTAQDAHQTRQAPARREHRDEDRNERTEGADGAQRSHGDDLSRILEPSLRPGNLLVRVGVDLRQHAAPRVPSSRAMRAPRRRIAGESSRTDARMRSAAVQNVQRRRI